MQNLNIDLKDYDLYRLIKLVTGETLVCTLVDENRKTVTFEYPFQVEMVKVVTNNGIRHHLSTTPYCAFTEDRTFTVASNQIQHINRLDEELVQPYIDMVYNNQNEVDDVPETVPEGTVIH